MKLNPYASAQIDRLHLSTERRMQVKACIEKYTMPRLTSSATTWEKVSKLIKYSTFRAFNALKALFGKSDWQQAKALFKDEVYERFKNEKGIDLNNHKLSLFNRVVIRSTIRFNASAQLNIILELNSLSDTTKLTKSDTTKLTNAFKIARKLPDCWKMSADLARDRLRIALNPLRLQTT